MKTNFIRILTIFIFLMGHIIYAQENTVSGTVVDNNGLAMPGVTVTIKGTKSGTQTDFDGSYSIKAKTGDVLIFSAVNLESLRKKITKQDLLLDVVKVQMTAKSIDLKEVIINEHPEITAENIGVIPYGQKKYTPAERKVYTATSTSVDKILNGISGRTAMLKKEVNVEKREALFKKIEYLFDENYYTERLKIPVDDIKGFQLYCVDDADFAVSLNTKNKTMSMFLITDLARKYLKIIENEK